MGDREGFVDEPCCPSCGIAYADHPGMIALCADNVRLKHDVGCYEAMKEGVSIRIANLEAKIGRLKGVMAEMEAQFYGPDRGEP